MNHKLLCKWGVACAAAFALTTMTTACSSENNDEPMASYTYRLSTTATTTTSKEPKATRALEYQEKWDTVDNVKIRKVWFDSHWEAQDKMYAYHNGSPIGAVTTTASGKTADFTGQVTSKTAIRKGDEIIFAYTGKAVPDNNKITIDLSKQDGNVGNIGKTLDLQWGKGTVTDVSNNTIATTVGMKHQMAFLGLILSSIEGIEETEYDSYVPWKDMEDAQNPAYEITNITIKGANARPEFDLLTGQFTSPCSDENGEIHISDTRTTYGFTEAEEGYWRKGDLFLHVALMPGKYEKPLTVTMDIKSAKNGNTIHITRTINWIELTAGITKYTTLE